MTIDLDQLESAAKAATPGPWDVYGDSNIEGWEIEKDGGYIKIVRGNVCKEDDAAFIAAVNPAVVLELIAELRKARAERDWLAGVLQRMHVTLSEVGLEAGRLFPVDKTATEWLEAARYAVEKEGKE